jgi:acetyltransferase-like isoleucine patch superfamily enzyme
MNKNKFILKNIFIKISVIIFKVILFFIKPFRRYFFYIRNLISYAIWKNRLSTLGKDTIIYPNVIIHDPKNVKIGNNVSIAEFCHIWGGGE